MRVSRFLAPALLALMMAACSGADASSARAAAPTTTEEVRALVQQFGLGAEDKDEAGDVFYDLGARAAPGLLEVARDPATNEYELESIMFIAAVYVREPAIFDALRTRAEAVSDPQERALRLKLIDGMRTSPGLPYPR